MFSQTKPVTFPDHYVHLSLIQEDTCGNFPVIGHVTTYALICFSICGWASWTPGHIHEFSVLHFVWFMSGSVDCQFDLEIVEGRSEMSEQRDSQNRPFQGKRERKRLWTEICIEMWEKSHKSGLMERRGRHRYNLHSASCCCSKLSNKVNDNLPSEFRMMRKNWGIFTKELGRISFGSKTHLKTSSKSRSCAELVRSYLDWLWETINFTRALTSTHSSFNSSQYQLI
jgi:hypothetical protein